MPLTILYAEDYPTVAEAVKATLVAEGWRVDACASGSVALARLEGGTPYALLLFDNELSGVSGLELVRRAGRLKHRQRTPIIMLSAGDVKAAAQRAGVDAFLRKPDGLRELVATIKRLLDA